ncbi:MAG: aminoacyl-tRNA hydrolase [Chitinivibrionales bacterium]|nr:aminoacyl-tRNA hydrolase [Chitinivibrionales bacterium]MBD3357661.1 aminoacyl-tRNA hydrolase [Chitinivibrionales bacterium]
MIRITREIALDEGEIEEEFVRSPGPGGQNVNKVATAVQLRFDIRRSTSLPQPVKARLARIGGTRVTREGILLIDAHRYRTRERNRIDARQRLIGLIEAATRKPKRRVATMPTRASRRKRLENKRQRAEKKRRRSRLIAPDD